MLDIIHEDLNRVKDKKPVEPIKSDIYIPDEKLAKLSWQKHI